MEVKYINPFVIATQTVFKTMLNIEIGLDKPIIKKNNTTTGDVTGVMGLAGDKKGTICISFTDKGALFVYKTLMGDEHDKISSEVVDAIGELTNIISGQARKELEKAGVNLKAAIPTVVVGRGVELHMISNAPSISLPFHFSIGNDTENLFVDFSFE